MPQNSKIFAGRCGVRAEQTINQTENNLKWVCTLCGWEYDGDIPFENLPKDWRCPLCGVGKELFKQVGQ